MRLVVLSHKECWRDVRSPTGYATVGGFPLQMTVLSQLFDSTAVLVPILPAPLPDGTCVLDGRNLRVVPLTRPSGAGCKRKFNWLAWLPRNLPRIWREVALADAVHAPVPGDVGTFGILVALAQRKPLFVRHCGTWAEPTTAADRSLFWLLEHIAGDRNVVLATGADTARPSVRNPNIDWIFATTLTQAEWSSLPQHRPWRRGEPFRWITVGRMSPEKNVDSVLRALAIVRQDAPEVSLDVVGDGVCLPALKQLAVDLGLEQVVRFHGNLSHDDVMRALTESHLFVFPTRNKEGFPKAVLEALACGLPVVATAVSVIAHLLKNGAGILLTDSGPEAVATAARQWMSDERRLANASLAAREASREYTLERWRDQIASRLRARWGPLRSLDGNAEP